MNDVTVWILHFLSNHLFSDHMLTHHLTTRPPRDHLEFHNHTEEVFGSLEQTCACTLPQNRLNPTDYLTAWNYNV